MPLAPRNHPRHPTTMTPLISIALSTYNGERYLAEQLASLLAQESVSFEIVVVDDHSSDSTPAILDRFAQQSHLLSWHANPQNLGPTRSFERALSLCRGHFLAPSDQDDVWNPRKLITLVSAIGDADLVYCNSAYIDAAGNKTGGAVAHDLHMMQGNKPLEFLFANSISGHASLFRAELFQSSRPFPADVYHDWWLALCAAGSRGIKYVDEPLVHFRRHADAFSPVGKKGSRQGKREEASKAWLEQFLHLMRAYGARDFRDRDKAARFAELLASALDGGSPTPLLGALWRHRAAAPHWLGIATLDCAKLQVQVLRKLRRSRRTTGST